jgi:hypothetical protein
VKVLRSTTSDIDFGQAVSASESLVAVASRGQLDRPPVLFIFDKNHGYPNSWRLVGKLDAAPWSKSSLPVVSISLQLPFLVVACSGDKRSGRTTPATVSIFTRGTSTKSNAGFLPPQVIVEDGLTYSFGTSLAFRKDSLVIGDVLQENRAYMYRFSCVDSAPLSASCGKRLGRLPPLVLVDRHSFPSSIDEQPLWSLALCTPAPCTVAPCSSHHSVLV